MKTFLAYLIETSGILSSILASSIATNSPETTSSTYKVNKGDTLSAIAKRNNTDIQTILDLNPNIKDPNKISVGETMKLNILKQETPTPKQETQKQASTGVPAWKPIISEFEGFSGDAYWDSKGKVWTIGKGSTTHPDGRPVRRGDSITKEQADEYMQHFVDTKITPRLQKIPTWSSLNPNQQAALTSFAYNVGPGFYGREGFETITTALKTQQGLANVPSALSLYNKSDGQPLEGLKRRRKAEGALWSAPVN